MVCNVPCSFVSDSNGIFLHNANAFIVYSTFSLVKILIARMLMSLQLEGAH